MGEPSEAGYYISELDGKMTDYWVYDGNLEIQFSYNYVNDIHLGTNQYSSNTGIKVGHTAKEVEENIADRLQLLDIYGSTYILTKPEDYDPSDEKLIVYIDKTDNKVTDIRLTSWFMKR